MWTKRRRPCRCFWIFRNQTRRVDKHVLLTGRVILFVNILLLLFVYCTRSGAGTLSENASVERRFSEPVGWVRGEHQHDDQQEYGHGALEVHVEAEDFRSGVRVWRDDIVFGCRSNVRRSIRVIWFLVFFFCRAYSINIRQKRIAKFTSRERVRKSQASCTTYV